MKYGKPEVHYGDALNDVRTGAGSGARATESAAATQPTHTAAAQLSNNVVATADNTNNESLTYI